VRDVELGPIEWGARLRHDECGTEFTAETADLQVDQFKKPGTCWFDGSADAAGLDVRFFVQCPGGDDIVFVDESTIPTLLREGMREGLR
jgi:hypothetical protein